jgi:hypothetical protein
MLLRMLGSWVTLYNWPRGQILYISNELPYLSSSEPVSAMGLGFSYLSRCMSTERSCMKIHFFIFRPCDMLHTSLASVCKTESPYH